MTNNISSFSSTESNGPAIKEIENKLPQLDSLIRTIEEMLVTLPTGTIRDYFSFQQVKARYNEKNMISNQADQLLGNILIYTPNLDAEIKRCKANIRILQEKKNNLQIVETQCKMAEAENLQKDQLFVSETLYDEMQTLTEKATQIIKAARAKVCPPYMPTLDKYSLANHDVYSLPKLHISQTTPNVSPYSPYTSETIFNDLINLGPIKKVS